MDQPAEALSSALILRSELSRASRRMDRSSRNSWFETARKTRLLTMRGGVWGGLAALLLTAFTTTAHADLKLCNRMSYVVDVAIGIDDKSATATRGWFRIDPAQCKVVAQGTIAADRLLLHARVLPLYGAAPAQSGSDNLCIASDNFIIAAARQCRAGQTMASFTTIQPSQTEDGNMVAYLAEDSEYDDEQAKLAAIQRLLSIAGYDTTPIDGVDGPKTRNGLSAFLRSRGLTDDIVNAPNFFETMVTGVQAPSANGLTWCNDTSYKVMASIANDDGKGAVIARGWYRIEPGKCLRPDVTGQPKQIMSFAEAVDDTGRAIRFGDKPLNWGGPRTLCTRESKFEIREHSDCAARGLTASGYATVDMTGGGKTLRFAMP